MKQDENCNSRVGEESTHCIILKQGTDIKMMNLILLKERESFDLRYMKPHWILLFDNLAETCLAD